MEKLKERLGEEYNIQLNTILKNNSITMEGVVILKDGEKISPNIYLSEYYLRYEEGKSMDEIVTQILSVYYDKVQEKNDIDINFTYEAMKDQIIFRLVNKEKNLELLKECPYVEFLDMAVTFHCLVQDGLDSIGTIRITKEHQTLWQVPTEEIYECAKKNTPLLMPPVIRKMEDVLKEMLLEDESLCENEEMKSQLERMTLDEEVKTNQAEMFILSNTKGINGASCVLYEDVIRNFAKLVQCNIYILPSSIHEVILLPERETYDSSVLQEMVQDINRTQVPYEEVLSDQIYYYSIKKNQFKCIS